MNLGSNATLLGSLTVNGINSVGGVASTGPDASLSVYDRSSNGSISIFYRSGNSTYLLDYASGALNTVYSYTTGGMFSFYGTVTSTGGFAPPSYTVDSITASSGSPPKSAGCMIYFSNGRKIGEASGSGTGVIGYWSNNAWRRISDDSPVAK